MTKTTLSLLVAAFALAAGPAAAQTKPAGAAAGGDLYATFQTSRGVIGVKLLPKKAPKTVENFVGLAKGTKEWTDPKTGQKVKKPLYDGTVFHRVIPNFMIQGGDPLTQGAALGRTASPDGRPFGTGDPGFRFGDEIGSDNRFWKPGMLAMANAGPGTNGSQFFITEVPTPHLNPGHTIFGEVVCGGDLIAKIARAGNAQTKLEHVVIGNTAPTCK
ncbi:MAG TPA: peptidylprolyl isomerase [Anaeromyxobacteraceae bacterium]|nr:peptidylprolyl isomerase [Anaeromyxobacteraceae bacterium]